MKIYWIGDQIYPVVSATSERTWISQTDRAAYKCKPLRDASSLGWQLLLPSDVSVEWDGSDGTSAIAIRCSDSRLSRLVVSHFKFGLVSFIINGIVQTDPGHDIFVAGPFNAYKDGISPLCARIEADWLPFHFAITWKITTPGVRIDFKAGEPFAQMFAMRRNVADQRVIQHENLRDHPELARKFAEWHAARQDDAARYERNGSSQRPLGFYDRGHYADGTIARTRTTRSSVASDSRDSDEDQT